MRILRLFMERVNDTRFEHANHALHFWTIERSFYRAVSAPCSCFGSLTPEG